MCHVGVTSAQPDADNQEYLDGDVGAGREGLRDERARTGRDRGDAERGSLEDLRRRLAILELDWDEPPSPPADGQTANENATVPARLEI